MTKKIRIGIVEDEIIIAEHIASVLERLNYEITFITDNATDAIEKANNADLLLIDIKIKSNLDGIDLANNLKRNTSIPFIFITSNSDDATVERAKYTNPAGFLTKPFKNRDIEIAVDIALHNHTTNINQVNQNKSNVSNYLFIKDKLSWIKLMFDDIYFIQAADNYSTIELLNEQIVITKSLKFFEENLPSYFIRVHKSYIVNTNQIQKIVEGQLLIGNKQITISETYKADLYNFLKI